MEKEQEEAEEKEDEAEDEEEGWVRSQNVRYADPTRQQLSLVAWTYCQ